MNTTQRTAWLILCAVMLDAVGAVYVGLILALRRFPPKPLGWAMTVFAAFAGLALFVAPVILMARRQSRFEPESDERDNLIKKRAILLSFVSGWLLLALVLLILALALGETGSVPVYLLTVIHFGLFLITLLIYSVTVLAQYGRTNRGEES